MAACMKDSKIASRRSGRIPGPVSAASHGQAAQLFQFRRELEPLVLQADAALHISDRQGYPFHHAVALTLRGWARVMEGTIDAGLEQLRRGLAMQAAAGADMERPYGLGLLADALLRANLIEEGLAATNEALTVIARRARAFFWEAELHRLHGKLLLRQGSAEAAEASLHAALATATRQGARSLELRAAVSLGRAWSQTGRSEQARELVLPIYAAFSEGFETPDLQDARSFLEELEPAAGGAP
jgi:predicted ATPase